MSVKEDYVIFTAGKPSRLEAVFLFPFFGIPELLLQIFERQLCASDNL